MKKMFPKKDTFFRDRSGLASFSAQVPYGGEEGRDWEDLFSASSDGKADEADVSRFQADEDDFLASKKVIFVSRDYRYLKRPTLFSVVLGLLLVAVIVFVYMFNYSDLTYALCKWAGKIVEEIAGTSTNIASTFFVPDRGEMYYLALDSTLPSYTLLIVTGIICLLLAVLAVQSAKNTLPVGIYVCMGAYLALISVMFFLFCPDAFPYTLSEYSELYMKQQLVLWIFVPIVAAFAIFMVNRKTLVTVFTLVVIAAVSFVFGCVRYPIYLIVLHTGSSLFMAPLFFTLGVLFDFLQMVAIYIVYIRYMSTYLDEFEHRKEWQW